MDDVGRIPHRQVELQDGILPSTRISSSVVASIPVLDRIHLRSEDRRLGFLGSIRSHVAMDGGGAGASEDKSEGWGEMMDAAWKRVVEKGKTLRSWNSIPGGKSMRWPSWRAPEGSQREVEDEPVEDNEEEKSELLGFLKALQLEEYAEVLADNGMYIEQLRKTTEKDLKKLGIPLGPRRKICDSIAKNPQWSGFQVK